MRLLRRSDDGELSFTNNLGGKDMIPPYAILSYTWGADSEEVTFEDLANGGGRDKPGYEKVRFCGEQTRQDGLQFFWIDTCCINKSNKAELSQAIRSMFRWYRNATRCYVYLSDVSSLASDISGEECTLPLWKSDFRKSRWFIRGWTLQELLAPSTVEFFSREWTKLGDKSSLVQDIYEATAIPHSALRGAPLSQFSVNERLRWREHRHTKLVEDGAYSLSGIFDIDIAPVYGEGAEGAFRRLYDEIRKLDKCIQYIRLTDPRDDKKRIEDIKGGLLEDSYRWILDNIHFRQWHIDPQSRVLWIKGDPGKGKTMLLCGIIDELQNSISRTELLSYIFIQTADSRINNAVAALRGLLYLLVRQQPSLISHIRQKYDDAGKTLFEDANAWIALTEIFTEMLQDTSLDTTYLIIDALDECITGLPDLLNFIVKQSSTCSRVKWIVSSRNWPEIQEQLGRVGHQMRLSLELNTESVSTAVSIFIRQRVSQLAQEKSYDGRTRDAVLTHLTSNANNTFLWVALVCQNLKMTSKRNVIRKLDSFPPGLDSLYEHMMQRISNSDDAELCKQILATVLIVYRPITLRELATLVEPLDEMVDNMESIQELVSLCGSILTIQGDTIYFVHQSAKDFLLTKKSSTIFPSGQADAHLAVFSRSLYGMSSVLQRDMYSLGVPSYPADQVKQPHPDPLAALRYACVHWADHLCDSNTNSLARYTASLEDGGILDVFFKKKYLYWLEALSLCRNVSKGVLSILRLEALIKDTMGNTLLSRLIRDAGRFLMYFKWEIGQYPLQAYTSALVFSPSHSLVKGLFEEEAPKGFAIRPISGFDWSNCLQTLRGHSSNVTSVSFSYDSEKLASVSYDKTVKIWDTSTGECLRTIDGHNDAVNSVAFSHDSKRVASASSDNTVKIWDTNSGKCLQTLKGHSDGVEYIVFSHHSGQLASASNDNTIRIWCASSGTCIQTLKGHHDRINAAVFSQDTRKLASASNDKTVKIWEISSGECLRMLYVGRELSKLSFSPSGSYLHTEMGSIVMNVSSISDTPIPIDHQLPQFQGGAISMDGKWIMYDSEKLLMLPSEYYATCSIVSKNVVGIGAGSGKVWICNFHFSGSEASGNLK